MKFFEPDGGTATPEAQQWLGIVLFVLASIRCGLAILHPPQFLQDKIGLFCVVPMVPFGLCQAWVGHRRKRGG